MKALAFANNDIAVIAWTFGGKLTDCLGFAIYRTDVRAGTETCLPAMATFDGQTAGPGRTTADDPVQKFFWKDVYARRGGIYSYRIVPMTGTPGDLKPMPYGPLISNQVQLSPHYGALSAYFNRGILATQATAHILSDGETAASMSQALETHIATPGDALRMDLAGEMIEALTTLPDEAARTGANLYCALYEFEDKEIIDHLSALKGSLNLILSNMPGGTGAAKTDDTYADQRQQIKAAGANVIDRFMPSGHIGHNKFQVLVSADGPQAALFGSTNVTDHALCAQTNNSLIARSPAVAAAYKTYWDRLQTDTVGSKAEQASPLRQQDADGPVSLALEDGSGTLDLWFSPNTPRERGRVHGPDETVPPDLTQVFDLISRAQQAVLFLAFEPGSPSIIDAVADAVKAKPSLFVRGAVTAPQASGEFATTIQGGSAPAKRQKGDPPLPEDYRVIHTQGVTADDAFGQWEKELNQAGHAVIHDKIVVIDPFSDTCVVIMGSHNLGYQASYNNDENLAIIKGHRGVAEAYAAHCLDVYDHYAWRYWLQSDTDKAWHFLATDDSWQDAYFDADNQVKSAELGFWLGASPASEALPTPVADATMRLRPALQAASGGTTPATGPHAAARIAAPPPGAAKGAPPDYVLVMRHAEKPADATDPDLSPAGKRRAQNLATYIPEHFGKPDFIFAAAPSKYSQRPVQTVEPLATQTDVAVESDIADQDYGALAAQLLDGSHAGKQGVVCWHHGNIPSLMHALGAQAGSYPDPWAPQVFNLILKIDFTGGGLPVVTQTTEPF